MERPRHSRPHAGLIVLNFTVRGRPAATLRLNTFFQRWKMLSSEILVVPIGLASRLMRRPKTGIRP